MKPIFGMAIEITPENASKLSIVSGGLTVYYQEDPKCYFIFPYDPEAHTYIVTAKAFLENYSFVDPPNAEYFVDVVEI